MTNASYMVHLTGVKLFKLVVHRINKFAVKHDSAEETTCDFLF